jgi:hypothetical protein
MHFASAKDAVQADLIAQFGHPEECTCELKYLGMSELSGIQLRIVECTVFGQVTHVLQLLR